MREFWVAASLLWLGGVGLRLTILAVPPVIALIQADLRLSGTEIGILSGLPVILFAIAALPGSLLIARFGALPTLVAGLLIAGVASGLRGALLDVFVLYAATILMSAGIAIMQPALSPLVRQWLPQRVSFGTALYSNGLLVAETLAVMLTIPVVLPLVDNSWRWSLAVWGVPLVAIAILTIALAPALEGRGRASAGGRQELVARLEQQADLANAASSSAASTACISAAMPSCPAHLTECRTAGPDQQRSHRPQPRSVAGILRPARNRRQARAARLAVRRCVVR